MARPPSANSIIANAKKGSRVVETHADIASGMILPNNSGDHSKGIKRDVPINDYDLSNKKYVDDEDALLLAKIFWKRTGTVLSPKNAGDDINTTGEIKGGQLWITGDAGFGVDPEDNAQYFYEFSHGDYADISVSLRPSMFYGRFTQTTSANTSIVTGMDFGVTASHSSTQGQIYGLNGTVEYNSNSSSGNQAALNGYWLLKPGRSPTFYSDVIGAQGLIAIDNAAHLGFGGNGNFACLKGTLSSGGSSQELNGVTMDTDGIVLASCSIGACNVSTGFSGFLVPTAVGSGTHTNFAAMTIADQNIATNNYGIRIVSDTIGLTLGAGDDTTIYWDGTKINFSGSSLTNIGDVGCDSVTTNDMTSDTGNIGAMTSNTTEAGMLSMTTDTITASADDTDVSEISVLFINPTAAVVIGGFTGGVEGQVLHVVAIDNDQDITLEHVEGVSDQDIYLHTGADETLSSEYGGWTLICDGSNWFATNT